VADTCECGDEPSGSIKCGEFLDHLQTGYLLKKDSAPWSKQVWERKRKSSIWNRIFCVHHRIISAVKGVYFVSDRKSCIVLRVAAVI